MRTLESLVHPSPTHTHSQTTNISHPKSLSPPSAVGRVNCDEVLTLAVVVEHLVPRVEDALLHLHDLLAAAAAACVSTRQVSRDRAPAFGRVRAFLSSAVYGRSLHRVSPKSGGLTRERSHLLKFKRNRIDRVQKVSLFDAGPAPPAKCCTLGPLPERAFVQRVSLSERGGALAWRVEAEPAAGARAWAKRLFKRAKARRRAFFLSFLVRKV